MTDDIKLINLGKVARFSEDRINSSDLTTENYTGTDNILQNKRGRENSVYVPDSGSTTGYQGNDILVANIRPYLQKIWFADGSGGSSADVSVLRVFDSGYNSKFVYYNLFQDIFFDFAMKGAKGSKMPRLDKKQILGFPIYDTGINDQVAIATILDKLDQKITLNNKINDKLDKLVRVLYDYWFTQFDYPDKDGRPYASSGGEKVYSHELKQEIPVGWEVKKLIDLFEFDKGSEPGSSAYSEISTSEQSVKFYRVGDIDGNSKTFIEESGYILTKVMPGDVVVTFDGTVGKMGISLNGAISGGLRHIYDKTNTISNASVWAIFGDPRIQASIHKYATGSVLLHASSSIEHLSMAYNVDVLKAFQEIIQPMYDQIVLNIIESAELADLRDWLIPMLMTGQVKVS